MEKMIEEKYDKLTEENFYKSIDSILKHCKLVILARGSSIKY